ncbi:homoserine kinase [Thermogymnomonas acidicola]|uniref:homoserine kinase n=1 Tax=Thermogymnomonas acidicola TaxID=399579 RepID=UPI000ADB2683|nr:homoserine kinase [Thermogymnomonas acidicola]
MRAELEIHIEKGIPYGLGLGSSGASAVGAVTAASELLGLSLSGEEIVRFAMQGEVASSGAAHPDNVAAATFGGAVAVLSDGPVVRRIPVHSAFRFLLIVPGQQREGKTRLARSLVPRAIETGKYVRNSRRLASLILGLSSGDRELLREGMNDEIVEPSRSPLFPFYWRIKEEALALNAAGVCVSGGAGPSILVIFDERTDVSGIERRATSILESFGMSTRTVRAVSAGGGAAIEEPGIVS